MKILLLKDKLAGLLIIAGLAGRAVASALAEREMVELDVAVGSSDIALLADIAAWRAVTNPPDLVL